MKEIELDTKILNKNLEITRILKDLDDLKSDYIELKESRYRNSQNLYHLLTEVYDRMYPMTNENDQTSHSILKDLRKVIRSLEK